MRQTHQLRATTYHKARCAGQWRTAIAALALSAAFCMALSGEATAQDNKWTEYFEGACPNETNTSVLGNMEIIAAASEKVLLPHRGVFSVHVPKVSAQYAAENTIAAFQHAQCLGFRGVEIDLKYTADDVVVLSHETILGRVNSVDDNGGYFNPENFGEVNIDGNRIRNAVSSKNMRRIQDLTWSQIRSQYFADKAYTTDGRYLGNVAIGNPESLTLKHILQQAPYSSNHFEKLVLVLDIQNFHTFELVQKVVNETGAWDRVIFKLWSEAVPATPRDTDQVDDQGVAYSGYELSLNEGIYPKGNYVIAFNQFNSRPCVYFGVWDCSISIEDVHHEPNPWDIALNSKYWNTSTHTEAMAESAVLLREFTEKQNANPQIRIIGAEVLAPDAAGYLRTDLLTFHDSIPSLDARVHLWGVVRKYDYQSNRCYGQPEEQTNTQGNPVTICPDHIPNAPPAAGHLTGAALEEFRAKRQGYFISTTNKDSNNKENIQYNGLAVATVKQRQQFGQNHKIQVYDIRELSDARQFGYGYDREHSQHRAAMMSTLTPLIE